MDWSVQNRLGGEDMGLTVVRVEQDVSRQTSRTKYVVNIGTDGEHHSFSRGQSQQKTEGPGKSTGRVATAQSSKSKGSIDVGFLDKQEFNRLKAITSKGIKTIDNFNCEILRRRLDKGCPVGNKQSDRNGRREKDRGLLKKRSSCSRKSTRSNIEKSNNKSIIRKKVALHTGLNVIKKMKYKHWIKVEFLYNYLQKKKTIEFNYLKEKIIEMLQDLCGRKSYGYALMKIDRSQDRAIMKFSKLVLNLYHHACLGEKMKESDIFDPDSEGTPISKIIKCAQMKDKKMSSEVLTCSPLKKKKGSHCIACTFETESEFGTKIVENKKKNDKKIINPPWNYHRPIIQDSKSPQETRSSKQVSLSDLKIYSCPSTITMTTNFCLSSGNTWDIYRQTRQELTESDPVSLIIEHQQIDIKKQSGLTVHRSVDNFRSKSDTNRNYVPLSDESQILRYFSSCEDIKMNTSALNTIKQFSPINFQNLTDGVDESGDFAECECECEIKVLSENFASKAESELILDQFKSSKKEDEKISEKKEDDSNKAILDEQSSSHCFISKNQIRLFMALLTTLALGYYGIIEENPSLRHSIKSQLRTLLQGVLRFVEETL